MNPSGSTPVIAMLEMVLPEINVSPLGLVVAMRIPYCDAPNMVLSVIVRFDPPPVMRIADADPDEPAVIVQSLIVQFAAPVICTPDPPAPLIEIVQSSTIMPVAAAEIVTPP